MDHQLLKAKLERYGVRGIALQIFSSYLDNRTQSVKLASGVAESKICVIKQGVPQGSILGPLLYILFANDIIKYLQKIPNVHVVCYADDTNIIVTGNDLTETKATAERVYQNIICWSHKNNLNLNKTKTTTIQFSLNNNSEGLKLFDDTGTELKSCEASKLLGVIFDVHLQWTPHVENLCIKLRTSCYALKFMSQHCSQEVLKTLYYANFHSHLRYGIVNWGNSSNVARVFLLQKYAVRILSNLNYRETCRNSFKNLKILTVAGLYILEVCSYVHKHKSFFLSNQVRHSHETRSRNILIPDQYRTTMYQKSFLCQGCKLYNSLDEDIRTAGSIQMFKSRLKKLLLAKNCYTINEFFLNVR